MYACIEYFNGCLCFSEEYFGRIAFVLREPQWNISCPPRPLFSLNFMVPPLRRPVTHVQVHPLTLSFSLSRSHSYESQSIYVSGL